MISRTTKLKIINKYEEDVRIVNNAKEFYKH